MSIVFIGPYLRTSHFALLAAGAGFGRYIPGIFSDLKVKPFFVPLNAVNFGIQQQIDIMMPRCFRHFRSGNAGCTVKRGKHLAQLNHFSTYG